jgi:hypothetical protein
LYQTDATTLQKERSMNNLFLLKPVFCQFFFTKRTTTTQNKLLETCRLEKLEELVALVEITI